MNQKLKIDFNSFAGKETACECGRTHAITTRKILLGAGAIASLGGLPDDMGLKGKALLVADANTWEAAGARVESSLAGGGCATERFIFPAGELHTDEHAVGSVFMAMNDSIGFITAVGSGTINDICRFVAKRAGLPFIVAGTAPSMDGFASTVIPITRGGFKMTCPGVAPRAVIGDTDVLKAAPLPMMAAGLGDIFGKVTALLDWRMSERLVGEYRCETVAGMVQAALDACMAAAPGLPMRDAGTVERLMEALVLSGIAMQMVGDSRPASGCEHQVAHFFEMRDMARTGHSALHGDKVGMAELMMLRLYEKFFAAGMPAAAAVRRDVREAAMRRELGAFADILTGQNCSAMYYEAGLGERLLATIAPDWGYWRAEAAKLPALRRSGEENIHRAGGPVRPSDLGYSRQDTRAAILYAMELRDKFTILRLAQLSGRLEGLAEELADEFC